MGRRVLRLAATSSDEEDEEETTNPPNLLPDPNPNPNPDSPLHISDDDDFVIVPDDLSSPSPPNPNPNLNTDERPIIDNPRSSPIDEFLRRLGLKIRPEFLEVCCERIAAAANGFDGLDVGLKAKKCFEQLLFADMNECGAGILPQNVAALHKTELEGPFVLQVDEIVNISAPIKDRYQNAPAGTKRCLKLSMTDGFQRVFGIEYRPIKELEALAPSGFKVVIRNVQVRQGVLMLVPEVISVLGGTVDYLDHARQRLVSEVNKPPRGKRKHRGVTLSHRAALAAWLNNTDTTAGDTQRNSTAFPQSDRVDSQSTRISNIFPSTTSGVTVDASRTDPTNAGTTNENVQINCTATPIQNRLAHTLSGITTTTEITNPSTEPLIEQVPEITMQDANNNNLYEEEESYMNTLNSEGGPHVSYGIDLMDFEILGEMEMEKDNGLILRGEREVPFTYLALLQARWEVEGEIKPFIRGKIKCFLTGVKGAFKYKDKFDLRALIDDGSLISEVIQKKVGYSPEEVNSALNSSDDEIKMDMLRTMQNFQFFVRQFEGTMVIEINRSSSLPIAIEWNQGCSSSDARLLLQRLKE